MAQQAELQEYPARQEDVQADRPPNDGAFRPLTWLTYLLIVALGLTAALDLVSMVSGIAYHDLIQRLISGEPVSLGQARSGDDRQSAIGSAQLGLFVVTAILFIVWFHRAYKNLDRLGISPLRWGSGWAVGAWFVPFLNLVRPKRIANDIWRGSDPDLPARSALPSGRAPWYYTGWWAAFIGNGLLSRAASANYDKTTLPGLSSETLWGVASDALSVTAAILAAIVVYRTAIRQKNRATRLARATAEPDRL